MCKKPKTPKQPKAIWDMSDVQTPKIQLSPWLRERFSSGRPTKVNPSVTTQPSAPAGATP